MEAGILVAGPSRRVWVQVRVSTLDVGDASGAEALIDLAESLAPVGGIFHLALNLADKLLQNQVRAVLRPQALQPAGWR